MSAGGQLSFMDRMKKVGKTMVDSGAKTMLVRTRDYTTETMTTCRKKCKQCTHLPVAHHSYLYIENGRCIFG